MTDFYFYIMQSLLKIIIRLSHAVRQEKGRVADRREGAEGAQLCHAQWLFLVSAKPLSILSIIGQD
jgi:hypothetical protein